MKKFAFSVVKFYAIHPVITGFAFFAFGIHFIPPALFASDNDWDFVLTLLAFFPLLLLIFSLRIDSSKMVAISFSLFIIWSIIFAVIQFEDYVGVWILYFVSFIISIFNAIDIGYLYHMSIEERNEIREIKRKRGL
ncbi:MAG: hypothetical protein IKB07_08395 [Lachnospiraceae bacterium]|nr:hypothetical protein [Lachnospiraceae bacterium]